jgi:hypothetical protein
MVTTVGEDPALMAFGATSVIVGAGYDSEMLDCPVMAGVDWLEATTETFVDPLGIVAGAV